MVLAPEKGLSARKEEETAARLAAYKEGLTEEELVRLVSDTKALQAYQEEEDPPEAQTCIPLLSRSDISPDIPVKLSNEEFETEGIRGVRHIYQTNGIGYLTILFDTTKVPKEKLLYLGLLQTVLGHVSTEQYSYGELFHQINAYSGGISFRLSSYPRNRGEEGDVGYQMLGIRAKYLYSQQAFVFRMIKEILFTSKIEDQKRLRELLNVTIITLEQGMQSSGHLAAATRAMARTSELSAWADRTGGISAYRAFREISRAFDEDPETLFAELREVMKLVFRPENMLVSMTAEEEGFTGLEDEIRALKQILEEKKTEIDPSSVRLPEESLLLPPVTEGFKTSGQIQFVAVAGNFRRAGLPYTGRLRVLRTLLSYDYLWMNVRVLGGAYGCMTFMKRSGDVYLVSYRDPHLAETLEIYRKIPEYLEKIELDDRTITKYVIGAISEMDHPMNASAKGDYSLLAFMTGLTDEIFQKEREEILSVAEEGIRSLAGHMRTATEGGFLCVIGGETAVEEQKALFDQIEALIGG